jgi:hypothetical protein
MTADWQAAEAPAENPPRAEAVLRGCGGNASQNSFILLSTPILKIGPNDFGKLPLMHSPTALKTRFWAARTNRLLLNSHAVLS